jgi:tellurite methyltransferase
MRNPQDFWNSLYEDQKKDFVQISEFFKNNIQRMQKGKTLDIAMGTGEHSIYLARQGFEMKGFDISDFAVKKALTLAQEAQVEISAQQTDLDLFIFGLMEYDSIIMTFYKPKITRYFSEITRALKQGGTLLIESYLIDDLKKPLLGDDEYLDCYYKSNEILEQLKGLKILFYNEGLIEGRHRVQCLAKKPLDKDMQKYGATFGAAVITEKEQLNKQKELAESLFKKS